MLPRYPTALQQQLFFIPGSTGIAMTCVVQAQVHSGRDFSTIAGDYRSLVWWSVFNADNRGGK